MASLRRQRHRACEIKRRYLSKAQAAAVLHRQVAAGGALERLHVYRCPFGQHWHIGHPMRRAGEA